MAMGDLRESAIRMGSRVSGSFRGSTAIRPLVQVHQHAINQAPNLGPVITSISTRKGIDGDAGTFQFQFKAGDNGGRVMSQHGGPVSDIEGADFIEIFDDDWVRIGVEAEGRQWLLMIGLVDSVSKSVESADGALDTTWTVSGRDITKVLAETDMLMAMHAGHDIALAYATFYGAVDALSVVGMASPGPVVQSLYEYMMRAGSQRNLDAPSMWAVPDSLPMPLERKREGEVTNAGRQASDIIQMRIDPNLDGIFSAYGSLLARPNAGGQVWNILQDHANPMLNELWIDLAPPVMLAGSALAFAAGTNEAEFQLAPTLFMRERPFPTSTSDAAWNALPTTTMDLRDVVSANLSRGNERYNYFLTESGGGLGFSAMVMSQAALAAAGGDLFEGVPAIDRESIPAHGVRRLEQTSTYVNETDGKLDIYLAWTRKLRDWYCLNHLFLSGDVETSFIVPGVRVGERFVLHGFEEDRHRASGDQPEEGGLEFYVQEIEHKIQVTDGVATSSSTITVTRGAVDPTAALLDHLERFKGKSPLPAVAVGTPLPAEVAAAAVAAGAPPAAVAAMIVQGPAGEVSIPAGED